MPIMPMYISIKTNYDMYLLKHCYLKIAALINGYFHKIPLTF